jgi:hypothetical protein
MQNLTSIQTASLKYETQEKPVLIMCSDMQDYVCKYAGEGHTMKLFFEYLAASFLKLWRLPVPDFALIQVKYDHVKHLEIPKLYVEKTAFGLKYSRHYEELHRFTENPDISKQKGYVLNRDNLLRIALFDIWMANEDRNFNNLNLMVDVSDNYNFVPIDHGSVFNSGIVRFPMVLLNENECLTDTPLFRHLFPAHTLSKDYIRNLKEYFYLCIGECKEKTDEILSSVPVDWNINRADIARKINDELFSSGWEDDVFKTFLEYIRSPFKF